MRVSGLPGAGKTTLLETAAAAGALTVVSRDLIRRAMYPGPAPHTPTQSRAAFAAMLAAAEPPLRRGGGVALDGCCFRQLSQRERARELARATGARLVAVHLELPLAEAIRRVGKATDHPANDRDAALVARVARDFPPPDDGDLVIDATLPPAAIWDILRRRIAAAGG